MFELLSRRRRRRLPDTTGHAGPAAPGTPPASPQSLIADALREIDRHLAGGGPAIDALLDVRLKLSPPAPSADRLARTVMKQAEYGPFGLLGLLFFDSYPAMFPDGKDRPTR
jgi:hypothetical protein